MASTRLMRLPARHARLRPAVFDVQGRADLHGDRNLRLDRPGLLPYRGPSPTLEATMGMRSGGLSAVLVLLVASACGGGRRSEEHTSELQSRSDLVCRLLLEKNNSPSNHTTHEY